MLRTACVYVCPAGVAGRGVAVSGCRLRGSCCSGATGTTGGKVALGGVSRRGMNEQVAFIIAIRAGVAAEVGAMLDQNEGLSELRFASGTTPLVFTATLPHVEVLRLLLGRGADIDASNDTCQTALHWAALSGEEEAVDILLDHGADASRVNATGATPLMMASFTGQVGIVKRLLRSVGRQGLDTQTGGGGTAFGAACCEGHVEVARLLLMEGADHTIARHSGTTARMEAEAEGQAECDALIQWWEGELERAYVVHKARRGLEVPATWQAPGAPVPAYLRARAQGNQRVPGVQLRGLGGGRVTRGAAKRLQEQGGEREGPCDGEKQATLQYVMQDLAPELYIELMAAFH